MTFDRDRLSIAAALAAAGADLRGMPDADRAGARLEAEVLLGLATGWSRNTLIAWPERTIPAAAAARFADLVARRLAGQPIAYLRGSQEFWGLELKVTPDTLIPRPETELLVELALALPDDGAPRWVADLGTGSGAIAAAIASERPHWNLIALERSAATVAVAASNLRSHGLRNAQCVRGDWLRALRPRRLDLIIANPPYVAEGDRHLTRGDPRFEPRAALASGPDGLNAIRAIAEQAAAYLVLGGMLAIEHGFDQGEPVRHLFAEHGLTAIETHRDLAGHERITQASQPADAREATWYDRAQTR